MSAIANSMLDYAGGLSHASTCQLFLPLLLTILFPYGDSSRGSQTFLEGFISKAPLKAVISQSNAEAKKLHAEEWFEAPLSIGSPIFPRISTWFQRFYTLKQFSGITYMLVEIQDYNIVCDFCITMN